MGTLRLAQSQFVSKTLTTASFLGHSNNVKCTKEGIFKTLHSSTVVNPSSSKLIVNTKYNNHISFLPKLTIDYSVSRNKSTTSKLMSFNEPLVENDTNICWKCQIDLRTKSETGQMNNLLTCPCPQHVLRNIPKNIDHFELFGLQRKFKMDLKKLAQKYKSMQRILHPDRFAQSTEEEKNLSDAWSPLVNEAYVCLKKPILRANYLLLLHGMPLQEKESIRLDANFLAEIVELNEEIIVAESRTDVAGLTKNVRDVLQDYYNAVEEAFDTTEDIEKARNITAHMQYYENLKKQLVKRETELGIVH